MRLLRRLTEVGPAHIGILVLETGFQRIEGDVGHPQTFAFPVTLKVVQGATAERVLAPAGGGTLQRFARAANELAEAGVDGVTTTCGVVSLFQRELAALCPVPFAGSSLLQVPMVQRLLPPGRRVGILAASAGALTAAHLAAVGIEGDVPIAGLPEGSQFLQALREGRSRIDAATHACEVLEVVARMVRDHPDLGALVSECANFPPYSAAIGERFGLPVYDAVTLIEWFQAGLRPRRFRATGVRRAEKSCA